jgi:hypothetical protein
MVFDKDYETCSEQGPRIFYPSNHFLSYLYGLEGLDMFINPNGNPFIIGEVKGKDFVEYFTKTPLELRGTVEEMDPDQVIEFLKRSTSSTNVSKILKVIEKAILDKKHKFEGKRDYSIERMNEESRRRYRQFDAFDRGESTINPYTEEYNERHYR